MGLSIFIDFRSTSPTEQHSSIVFDPEADSRSTLQLFVAIFVIHSTAVDMLFES